jgi:predicted AlkP superfamily pyrophosphatase or phosphodiesterase
MSVTVLLLIDGFSYKYLSKAQTPFLSSLTSNSISGPARPSGFFTSHSLYSGIYPDKHHNLFMYGYDPQKSPFKRLPLRASPVDNLLPFPVKDIFRLCLASYLSKKNKVPPAKFASIPFSMAPYFRQFKPWEICPYPFIFDVLKDNHIQTIWDTRDYTFEQKKYLGNFLYKKLYGSRFTKWLKDSIKKAENSFIFVQFPSKLDKLGHIFGPGSDELKNELKKTDDNLRSLFNFISRYHKDFFFGIVSDHGMTAVHKYWDISKHLKKLNLKSPRDYVVFLDATCARFWFRDSGTKDYIKQFLNQFSNFGKVLTSEELKTARLPLDRIWGDLLFAVEPGILILPNFLQGKKPYRGMHGYFEKTLPELQCVFLLHNKSLSPQTLQITLPDIAATVLKTFGIPPPEFYEGVCRLT